MGSSISEEVWIVDACGDASIGDTPKGEAPCGDTPLVPREVKLPVCSLYVHGL
jgi:hypothetical protein